MGTMSGRSGEVVDMVSRRRLDFCCLQETRWKGGSARVFGADGAKYKFFWSGGRAAEAGVGMLVAERWIDKVIEVRRLSERLIVVRVTVGKSVLNLVSVYAPQRGREMEEKENFLALLGKTLSGIRDNERVIVGGDFNCHVGAGVEGFDGVHGGHGFGKRDVEGEMLLQLAESLGFIIVSTYFQKEDGKKVTYDSGDKRSAIDFVLVRKCERSSVWDVKVIPGEPCIQQHRLVVAVVKLSEHVKRKRQAFSSRCRVWKLKDAGTQSQFRELVEAGAAGRCESNVEGVWNGLKSCLLESAETVCGRTKGPQRHRETWWWNSDVAEAVGQKRKLFRVWKKTKSKLDKAAYQASNRLAKKAVYLAQEGERKKLVEKLAEQEGRGNLFRVAKQMMSKNRDVVGDGCIKDSAGDVIVEQDKIKEVWRRHYEKLLNEEFDWNRDGLETVDAVSGPADVILVSEVRSAIAKMKAGKAVGQSGIGAEMLKAAGEAGVAWVTDLCNVIVKEGRIPADWKKSWIVSVYKGKGDSLDCGSYRGIKLLDQVMKVFERVIEARLRNRVKIDDMQFGFSPGKGTTDAIFIIRQLQERFLDKKKELWMAFVDLEKAFDRVPREVLWWALRKLGVDEWLINVVKSMYDGATTAVKLQGGESKEFEVQVGVHQGSVLSPLLFVIVLEALSKEFRGGLPWELLYADDLALMAGSRVELMEKIKRWKDGMEDKGLRVNMGKTKVMRCVVGTVAAEDTGKWPCGVCRKGVGRSSIRCSSCLKWVHKRCAGVRGSLKEDANFRCAVCVQGGHGISGHEKEVVIDDAGRLEWVDRFCYLGDVLGCGGGVADAIRFRVKCAWGKFMELAPLLTLRGMSRMMKGKLYSACVQSVLVYGSETWASKSEDVQRMQSTERMMVRWMCGVSLKDAKSSQELLDCMGILGVAERLRRGRLRWFGHVERKGEDDWVSRCRDLVVEGYRGRGRGRKSWMECVGQDIKALRLRREDAGDREGWRRGILGDRPTRARAESRTLKR